MWGLYLKVPEDYPEGRFMFVVFTFQTEILTENYQLKKQNGLLRGLEPILYFRLEESPRRMRNSPGNR